jgi:hypothetical protein
MCTAVFSCGHSTVGRQLAAVAAELRHRLDQGRWSVPKLQNR